MQIKYVGFLKLRIAAVILKSIVFFPVYLMLIYCLLKTDGALPYRAARQAFPWNMRSGIRTTDWMTTSYVRLNKYQRPSTPHAANME